MDRVVESHGQRFSVFRHRSSRVSTLVWDPLCVKIQLGELLKAILSRSQVLPADEGDRLGHAAVVAGALVPGVRWTRHDLFSQERESFEGNYEGLKSFRPFATLCRRCPNPSTLPATAS